MSYTLKGRAGLTAQMPLDYVIKFGVTADSLGISRHKLTVLALLAGLDIAVAQVKAEQAAAAASSKAASSSQEE